MRQGRVNEQWISYWPNWITKFSIVYLGNIVLFSQTTNEHIDQVWKVVTLLKDTGVTLNLKENGFTNHKDHPDHFTRPGA